MKVVVAALSAPQHLNGVSRHAANVVRGLLTRPEISEVHLLAGAWQQQTYADAIARHDARLHIHPVTSRRATVHRNHWYYSELPRIASQLDADVVHLAYPMPVSARGFPCPTVVSLHDLYRFRHSCEFRVSEEHSESPGGSAVPEIGGCDCLRFREHAATTRPLVWQQFRRQSSHDLEFCRVCHGKLRAWPATAPQRAAISACASRSIGVTRTFRSPCEVFEQCLRDGCHSSGDPTCGCRSSGTGDAHGFREQIRSARLDRKVVVLCGIRDAELQWCYRNCELLLAPSIVEGFGLPVVEALLAGCRVVCSDIPAFREVGMDVCHYVPLGPGEIDAFTDAIRVAREGAAHPAICRCHGYRPR